MSLHNLVFCLPVPGNELSSPPRHRPLPPFHHPPVTIAAALRSLYASSAAALFLPFTSLLLSSFILPRSPFLSFPLSLPLCFLFPRSRFPRDIVYSRVVNYTRIGCVGTRTYTRELRGDKRQRRQRGYRGNARKENYTATVHLAGVAELWMKTYS